MSSSAFESGDSGGRERSPEETSKRPSAEQPRSRDRDQLPDPSLLEKVLRETLSGSPESSVSPAELATLLGVAARYKGQRLTRDPVVLDLVQCVLEFRFANLDIDAARWREMSAQIAGTLMEDEQSHERLETFWCRLAEALP